MGVGSGGDAMAGVGDECALCEPRGNPEVVQREKDALLQQVWGC